MGNQGQRAWEEYKKQHYSSNTSTTQKTTASTNATQKATSSTNAGAAAWEKYKKEAGLTSSRQIATAQSWSDSSIAHIKDAESYLSKWHRKDDAGYASIQNKNKSLLEQAYFWRNEYAGDEEAKSYINEIISALKNVETASKEYFDHYGKWETEDSYNKWLKYSTPERRQEQYVNNQKRLEELQMQKKALHAQPGMNPYTAGIGANTMPLYGSDYAAREATRSKATEIEKEIAALEKEIRLYEYGEVGDDGFYYGYKTADEYGKYLKDAGFVAAAQNRGYQNATRSEMDAYDAAQSNVSTAISNGGYADDEGNVYNAKGELIQRAESEPVVQDKLGLYLAASEDDLAEAYDILNASNGSYGTTWADIMQEGDTHRWKYLKDDELNIYYGLLRTKGQEAAYKYLDDMQVELGRRENDAMQEYVDASSGWNQVGLNALSVPMSMAGGIAATVDNVSRLVQGKQMNPYSRAQMPTRTSGYIRSNTAEEIDAATGGKEIPGLGFTWGDAYQSGMSMIDSLVGAKVGGKAYQAVMSMGAASSEATRLYSQGASTSQIVLSSFAAGAAEWVFEKYSIENLINLESPENGWQFIKNALIQGGIELSEEAATELANIIADGLIMQSESDWAKALEENNGDYWAATKEMAIRVANAGLGGFLSGGGSGALYQGAQAVAQMPANARTKRNYSVAQEDLVKEALEIDPNNAFAKRMQEQLNKGKDLTGYQLNKLIQQNEQAIATMPDAFANAIEADTLLASAARQVLFEDNTTWNQRSQGYRDVLMKLAEDKVKGKTAPTSKASVPTDNTAEVKTESGAEGNVEPAKYGSIQTIKNGKVTVKMTDGTEVDLKDADLDPEDGVRIETIASIDGISAEDASGIFNILKAGSKNSQYDAIGAREAYRYGYYGLTENHLNENGTFSKSLTPEQRKAVYEMGKKARDTSVTAETGKIKQMREAAGQKEPAKLRITYNQGNGSVRDIDGKTITGLSRKQRAAVSFAKVLHQLGVGTDFEFFESYLSKTLKDKNGNRARVFLDDSGNEVIAYSGVYQTADGKIRIDLNAYSGRGLALNAMSHELVHFIKQWSPDRYRTMADIVGNAYGNTQMSMHQRVLREQARLNRIRGTEVSYDKAYDEVVANALNRMLDDGTVLDRIAEIRKVDGGLADKMIDCIRKFIKRFAKVFSDNESLFYDTEDLMQFKDTVEGLRGMFAEALVEASDNRLSSVETEAVESLGENATVETNEDGQAPKWESTVKAVEEKLQKDYAREQYSSQETDLDRITLSMTDSERTAILQKKSIVAEPYEGQAEDAIKRNKADLDSGKIGLVKSAIVRIGEEFEVFTDYNISDVKVKISLSKRNLRESVSKDITPKQIARLMPVLKSAVENAVGIESHANRYFYDTDIVRFDNLVGGYVEGNNFVPVRFGLKHRRGGEVILYVIIDQQEIPLNEIKAEVVKTTDAQNMRKEASRSAYMISLADIVPFVNGKDLLRYLPDDMLDAEQKRVKWEGIAETIKRTNDKNDEHYADYIRMGKTKNVEQMVANAAKDAGYTIKAWHGSRHIFDKFSKDTLGSNTRTKASYRWFFAGDKETANSYYPYGTMKELARQNPKIWKESDAEKMKHKGKLYELYIKMENPLIVDVAGYDYAAHAKSADAFMEYVEQAERDGNDGIILYHVRDNQLRPSAEESTVYMFREPSQAKSADPITYDEQDNIIPISERFNEKKDELRYSTQETDNITARDLLSSTDVATIKNEVAKKKLSDYQKILEVMNAEDQKLREIRAEIKELSFAKAPKDTKKLKDLKFEAIKINNHISVYEGQLQRMEKELQSVVKRERAKVVKEAEKRDKAVLAKEWMDAQVKQNETLREYRETRAALRQQESDTAVMEREFIRITKEYEKLDAKSGKTISELRTKLKNEAKKHRADEKMWMAEFGRLMREYEAADRSIDRLEQKIERQKAVAKERVEGRNKTAMRHKIQNVVKELNSLLLSNDKKRHVPDNLKKAVAEALDLVNMDTVGAEERAAKYADLIAKEQANANPDQDKIDSYISTMENILRNGEKMGQRLNELHAAYEEIQNSDDPDIANAYDPVIAGAIQELSATIGNTSVKNMSIEQLSDVYDVYRAVLTRVRDANKAMAENIKASIEELAKSTIREVQSVGGSNKYRISALDAVRKFDWDNLKPVYAMERIGSSTLTEVFNNVRSGEDVWARDVSEARAYYLEKSKKYGYDKWDFEKKYRFESNSGIPFELTLEQMMSLYAYSKREQAGDHLRLGGFVFDSNIETTKEKDGKRSILKYKVNTADAHQITPEIMADIIGNLTREQALFVDEMQDYLSAVMGAKGNEVTSKMYGIKLFKEKFYFPLKSAKQFMFEQNEVSGEVRIKNSGFTNKVVTNANNPVILSNFMDVWSNHVNDMSMYHAFTLPLEDFNRVFNYNTPKKDGIDPISVKGTIQNAYSPAAVQYVKNLITDLNGGARTDSTTGVINKLTGLFKKGAVFASLSVVVQQPSAIARATALIDTKYFIGPKIDQKRHKYLWDEVKQYAPVALIKEMGYFDTNMGKSTQDYITGKEYSGFSEQMKALVTDSNYRDEILSKAPAFADEVAWCGIWEAVKRETKAKHPSMDTTSEAFLKLAGKRFTEVITKTQVYDSVLARSANMRSKDTGMKMATAFMAEPTTSINMIEDAIMKGRRGDKRYARTAIGAVIASQILNSILVSFVYAARDDDEDETYLEKYIGSLAGGIIDGLNPATYIPFIKDIVSIVQGYDVERSDMAVVSDLWNAWKSLSNENVSMYRKVEGFAGSIAQIFGLPVKNIMRDVRGIYNAIMTITGAEKATGAGVKYAIGEAITGKTVSNKEQLYEARMAGDTAHTARVEARYDDMDSADAAVVDAIKDRFKEGKLDEATALKHLVLYAGKDGTEAHWTMDKWKYQTKKGTGEGYSKYYKIYEAIKNGESITEAVEEHVSNGSKENEVMSEVKSSIGEWYRKGEITKKEATDMLTDYFDLDSDEIEATIQKWSSKVDTGIAYDDIKTEYMDGNITSAQAVDMYVKYGGYTKEDAEETIADYDFENEYGFSYSNRVTAYKEGIVSSSEMKSILMEHGNLKETDAEDTVKAYEFLKNHQQYDLDVNDAKKFTVKIGDKCKDRTLTDFGVSVESYLEYVKGAKNCKGVDADGDGYADRNTKAIQLFDMIDKLPISSTAKDGLAYITNAKGTINKYAPWHQ